MHCHQVGGNTELVIHHSMPVPVSILDLCGYVFTL